MDAARLEAKRDRATCSWFTTHCSSIIHLQARGAMAQPLAVVPAKTPEKRLFSRAPGHPPDRAERADHALSYRACMVPHLCVQPSSYARRCWMSPVSLGRLSPVPERQNSNRLRVRGVRVIQRSHTRLVEHEALRIGEGVVHASSRFAGRLVVKSVASRSLFINPSRRLTSAKA